MDRWWHWVHVLTFDSAAKHPIFSEIKKLLGSIRKRLSRIDSESVLKGGEGDLLPPLFGV
jgi:hypothetical protein